jgi:hypothetical protein
VGFLHLKPTELCQISNLIFEIKLWRGVSINIPWNNILRTAKFLPTWIFARVFNWLNFLGGFLHLKPKTGCQISTLIFDFCVWRGGLHKYPMQNMLRTAKFLSTWGLDQRYCPGLYLSYVPVWVSTPQAHSRVSNINLDIQWSTMLWDIPYSTNSNVIPGISVFMGHSSRPP